MATVKGQLTLEFIDSRTGLGSRPSVTYTNQITEYFYADIVDNYRGCINTGNLLSYGNRLGVSNNSTPTVARQYTTIGNIKGSGAVLCQTKNHPEADHSPWTYRSGENPPYCEIFNVLNYPGSGTRTFQTVFLARDASTNDGTPVYAYVVAPEPIVQDTYEYINLYYKIINSSEDNLEALAPSLDNDIIHTLFSYCNSASHGPSTFTNLEFVGLPVPQQTYSYLRRSGVGALYYDSYATSTASRVDGYFTHYLSVNIPPRHPYGYDYLGRIINSVGVGNYDAKAAYYQIEPFEIPALANGCQGYYPHNAVADTPFVDVSASPKPASGTGTLNLGGTWTGTLSDYYRIVVTESGAVGVSKYKLQRKRHTGFIGNTYASGRLRVPYINHSITTFTGFHGHNNSNFMRVSDDKVASWDSNGVCVIDLSNGDYKVYESSTGLIVTDIAQVTCDATITGINSGAPATKIWVACRDTGLWQINLSTDICTNLVSDPCFAVDIGYLEKVFAVFGGSSPRLANSDNYAVPLDFTISAVTSDWTAVKFIKCDPNSSAFQMLVKYGNGSASAWWNNTTPNGNSGPSIVVANQNSYDCSDTDSTWFGVVAGGFYSTNAHYVVKLNPGTTTASTISTTQGTACAPNPCIIGDKLLVQYGTSQGSGSPGQAYSLHNTSNGSLINRFDFIGVNWTSSQLTPSNNYLIYMGRTLTLYGSINENYADLVSTFNVASYAFENYGWDGSTWVLDNVEDKTTHLTQEPLLDGITVAFGEGTTGTSFFATDYYDIFYNKGMLKSNTKTFTYNQYVSYRERVTETITADLELRVPETAPYTVKVPTAPGGLDPDPNFLLVYNILGSLFEFKLGGVVAVMNFAGQAPSAGQVTIASNGTLTFNAADAGKLITSLKYEYMRG